MSAASFVIADKSWLQIADASQSGLDPGAGDFSIAMFCYCVNTPSAYNWLVRKGAASQAGGGFGIALGLNCQINLYFGDYVGTPIAGSAFGGNNVFDTGQWNSLIFTFDRDGNAACYVNGTSVGTIAISTCQGAINNTGVFSLGYDAANADYWLGGLLSHVRFWSRLLTVDEIARQANIVGATPYARPYAQLSAAEKVGLVSSWELQESVWDSTHTAIDSHGTNHLSFTASAIIQPGVRNGGFETAGGGGADVFANWAESVSGTSTINNETTVVYAGAHACRLDIDSSNSVASIAQTALTANKLYSYSVYAKASAGTPSLYAGGSVTRNSHTLTTSYAAYSSTVRPLLTDFQLSNNSAASVSLYLDNVTLTAQEILTTAGPGTTTAVAAMAVQRRRQLQGVA